MLARCGWVGDFYALVRRVVVAWEEVEWLWMLWADEWMWMRYHLSQRVQGGSQVGGGCRGGSAWKVECESRCTWEGKCLTKTCVGNRRVWCLVQCGWLEGRLERGCRCRADAVHPEFGS